MAAGILPKPEFIIEALNPAKHRREEFSCEFSELTEFLQKRARKEMEVGASACFVLVETSDPGSVVGYYTLSQTSVVMQKLPEAARKKLPHYPELGATLIGRLARDSKWHGKGIGPLLLVDALRRSVKVKGEAGAVVVVTDPKDENARKFYEKFGFLSLDERRLFILIKELEKREKDGWTA